MTAQLAVPKASSPERSARGPHDRGHARGRAGPALHPAAGVGRRAGARGAGDRHRAAAVVGAARHARSAALDTFTWVIFTSVNGVAMVDRRLAARGLGVVGAGRPARGRDRPGDRRCARRARRAARPRARRVSRRGAGRAAARRSSTPAIACCCRARPRRATSWWSSCEALGAPGDRGAGLHARGAPTPAPPACARRWRRGPSTR